MAHDGPKDINCEWTSGNFALFALVPISTSDLDCVLASAHDTLGEYYFWLASSWSAAPSRNIYPSLGTKPPIPENWRSPFFGRTVEDVVMFMKDMPEDANVDYHHFAVLGRDFSSRKLLRIYRIGNEDLVGDELDSVLCSAAGQ
jgi:hypothetical protein